MKTMHSNILCGFFGILMLASCEKQTAPEASSKDASDSKDISVSPSTTVSIGSSSLVVIKVAEPEDEHEEGDSATENTSAEKSEHRQLGAHVHGAASMNVTVEADQLNITMSIPGMEAVGFEHAAISTEEQTVLNNALSYLQNPGTIFVTPAQAQCQLLKGEVATALLNKAAKSNGHADVDISYEWQCKNVAALTTINIALFSHFHHLQKIKASWITKDKQGLAELTPAETQLKLE